ncbi:hypothetical protein TNIN_165091 [Trichonephila inaurata madagascariensis]|uniref:Uncharacterized protein n=1 Tax=Trichonephila inaurata madagascariensis TaxID=2747483 RepID=A0A8X6XUF4_9ARAC|nr:hypothetical protein TNIN_165091 [Trichonephila inaurata madagascariensis]
MDPWVVLLTGALIILAVWLSRGRPLLSPNGVTLFISGCDSGIGKQLAVYFAEMGCLVFAGCLDPRTARLSLPDTVRTIRLDITDEECVRQAISTIQNVLEEEKRELWALVNNAGVCVYGLFEWQTPQQRDRQVQVNLLGTMRLTKACLPLLQKSKGRIITMSSVNGSIAYPGLAPYCATKFALEGFNDALRNEVGPQYGIRVITIQPGDYARITSIMSQHRRNMEEMWDAMSFQQQEQCSKYFQKYHQRVLQSYGLTSPTSWENSPLLHDVKEAVLAENPASKYLSAPFIHRMVYKLMITVPQSWTDFILIKVVHYIDKPEESKQNGH